MSASPKFSRLPLIEVRADIILAEPISGEFNSLLRLVDEFKQVLPSVAKFETKLDFGFDLRLGKSGDAGPGLRLTSEDASRIFATNLNVVTAVWRHITEEPYPGFSVVESLIHKAFDVIDRPHNSCAVTYINRIQDEGVEMKDLLSERLFPPVMHKVVDVNNAWIEEDGFEHRLQLAMTDQPREIRLINTTGIGKTGSLAEDLNSIHERRVSHFLEHLTPGAKGLFGLEST